MPIKPRRLMKKVEASPLTDALRDVLLFRKIPNRDTPEYSIYVSRFFDQGERLLGVWRDHEKELMTIWTRGGYPGQPWALAYLQWRGLNDE
jgi:hypothetical protein